MSVLTEAVQDVMQVCHNGHVVTDLLRTHPDQGRGHCDQCGAITLDRCRTCGLDLPGAIPLPGMVPVGQRQPPHFCPRCGASFPWSTRGRPAPPPNALTTLEQLLRRLPRAIRQLRHRQGEKPAFRVEDERDLEDLVRALLPLHFDDVRPQQRTPRYAAGTRTDFLLAPERLAVTVKIARATEAVQQLDAHSAEDAAYYAGQAGCRKLVGFVYDPLGRVPDRRRQEALWSRQGDELEVRCIIEG